MPKFKGVPVNNSMMPIETKAAFPDVLNENSFDVRLKEGGTIELEDSVWSLGPPNFAGNSLSFFACDTLRLKGKSGIVTNGNTVIIFVNKLESENGFITSFRLPPLPPGAPPLQNFRKAEKGGDGNGTAGNGEHGKPGDGGGLVSIHVVQELIGVLHVDLSGQDGGNGGHGTKGGHGPQGSPGTPCQAGVCGPIPHPCCKHDGGPGGKGGRGGQGGHGGRGGNAGSGGIFQLFNIGDKPIPDASFTFIAEPGSPGIGGNGGSGGDGGPGGPGGDGNVFCHGGPAGPQGDPGPSGNSPGNGEIGGVGQSFVQNLALELMLKRAGEISNP